MHNEGDHKSRDPKTLPIHLFFLLPSVLSIHPISTCSVLGSVLGSQDMAVGIRIVPA